MTFLMYCLQDFQQWTRLGTSSDIYYYSPWNSIRDLLHYQWGIRKGNQNRTPRAWSLPWLQHIKVIVQNKLMIWRTAINSEIIAWIAQPLRSNHQVQLFGDRLALLVSMKEQAQGLPYHSLDEEIAQCYHIADWVGEGDSFSHRVITTWYGKTFGGFQPRNRAG